MATVPDLSGNNTVVDKSLVGFGFLLSPSNAPVSMPYVQFANLPNAMTWAGKTVRVTDRAQRFATSDGTVWRDQTGAVFA